MFHLTLISKALECFRNKLEFYNQRFHKKNQLRSKKLIALRLHMMTISYKLRQFKQFPRRFPAA